MTFIIYTLFAKTEVTLYPYCIYCRGNSSDFWSDAYPNPASTELTIDRIEENDNFEPAKSTTIKVLLYSHSTTKLAFSKDYPSSTQQIKIDTSKLPNGTYYLNIIENSEKVKEQIIIVNH